MNLAILQEKELLPWEVVNILPSLLRSSMSLLIPGFDSRSSNG
jgi:hypothetical protein